MVQWLRICLAMQGTQVWSLVPELGSHMPHNNRAHVPYLLSLCSGAWEPQVEKPPRTQRKTPHGALWILQAAAENQCNQKWFFLSSYKIYFYRLRQLRISDCRLDTGSYWNSANFLGHNNAFTSHSTVHFASSQAWVQLLDKTHQLVITPTLC